MINNHRQLTLRPFPRPSTTSSSRATARTTATTLSSSRSGRNACSAAAEHGLLFGARTVVRSTRSVHISVREHTAYPAAQNGDRLSLLQEAQGLSLVSGRGQNPVAKSVLLTLDSMLRIRNYGRKLHELPLPAEMYLHTLFIPSTRLCACSCRKSLYKSASVWRIRTASSTSVLRSLCFCDRRQLHAS